MKKLRAVRSSYGDLGRVRRNQIVEVDDNLSKKLLASKLYSTDLTVPVSAAEQEAKAKAEQEAKAKAEAEAKAKAAK